MKDKIDFSSIPTFGWISIIIIGILVYFVAPKVVEIYNSNLNDNQTRADNS